MTRATQVKLPKVGSTIAGKYTLERILGRGGMAVVYEATHIKLRQTVAIKLLLPAMCDLPDTVKRFEREARAAARIGHEGIVAVRAIGHDDAQRTRFIVHEYLRGSDVAGCLGELRCLPVRAAIAITVRVMDALIAAHAAGIVHRDIKPENVFLHERDDGRVVPKVIDFGVAKVSDELDRMERAATGTVVGTPWYMSPEQAQGSSLVDARTDVWSVGAMLYEMVCGTPPFAGTDPDAVMAQIIFGRPTPLRHHRPSVPVDLQVVIHRAMEHDLDRRYATMAEFRASLMGCQLWCDVTPADAQALLPRPSSFDALVDESALVAPDEPLSDHHATEPEPVAVPSAAPPEAPPELLLPIAAAPPRRAPRRRRGLPGLGVALTVLCGAALAVGVMHWIQRPQQGCAPTRPDVRATVAPVRALSDSTARLNSR